MQKLWYQKFRPLTTSEYVFVDDQLRNRVEGWIEKKEFPHLLLSGPPGSGKTSLAQLLADNCGFEEVDVKFISASINRKIDDFTDEVQAFSENQSFGPNGRVIILNEADSLSPLYQKALRNLIGDDEGTNCRFILTCNYPHKISEALKSRLRHYTFNGLDRDQFTLRVAEILTIEKVKFDMPTLEFYVDKYYPDLRKTIDSVEANVFDGVLQIETDSAGDNDPDWMIEAVAYFQEGMIQEAREHIIKNISYEDYEHFYEMLYKNLDWFAGDNEDKKDATLLAIKDAYVDDSTVANREIILSACLAKLSRIRKK